MRLNIGQKTLILSVFSVIIFLIVGGQNFTNKVEEREAISFDSPKQFSQENSVFADTIFMPIYQNMSKLLKREHLTGGANIAVSIGGRMVYARGIGYSDVEDSVEMTPDHRMRVASVSKLITAVAVMHLVEEGKLTLNQKVFGPTGVLNGKEYSIMRDQRMKNVTVRNLLNHSGGWTTKYGDPMFMPHVIAREMGLDLPIGMSDIIKFMQTKRMHFNPGSYSVYSNFGYGILGEVVEAAAGMPYESYVQSEVFAPLGIYDAELGYSHIEERLENEASYYEPDRSLVVDYADAGKMSRRAYGGTDIHTLGSAGGWVLSAVDLLKLALTIDNFASVPDQLSRESIDEMAENNSNLGPLGWRKVLQHFWFRTGTLAATSAIVCRRPDGICFVVTINSSNSLGPSLAVLVANKMNESINRIKRWPEYDLLEGDMQWVAYKERGGARVGN